MWRLLGLVVLIPSLLGASATRSNRIYYVFTDDRGQTQIEDSIPPDYKQRGYRIVNEQGVTLEVVPASRTAPRKSPSETALSRTLSVRDKALLQTFASVEDLVAARDKHLLAMDGIIDVTKFNLDLFSRNLDALRQSAKKIEATGEGVPERMHSDITEIQRRVEENREYIARKQREKETIRARYGRDISRFKELLESSTPPDPTTSDTR